MAELDESPAAQAFAQGLQGVLIPAVIQCDQQMQAVLQSQEELSLLIDRLASALQAFKASQDRPKLSEYANKLVRCRRRLRTLQQTVATINVRIQSIRSLVRKNQRRGATTTTVAASQPHAKATEEAEEQAAAAVTEAAGAEAAADGSPSQSTAELLKEYNPPSVAELLQLLDWEQQ